MRDIPGYENLYAATTDGRIFSYKSNKFLKLRKRKDGYLQVNLYKDGTVKTYRAHRLIAATYLENPLNLPQVNHIDEDKTNNALSNLEFCNAAYNINYSQAKKVICLEISKIFNSINEAAKVVDIDPSGISRCLAGKQKTAGGYHWKYYEENEKEEM